MTIAQGTNTEQHPPLVAIYGLVAVWVLSMISLPIFRWTFGDGAIVWGVNITTVLQAVTVLAVLHTAWGLRRTLLSGGAIIVMTWAVEFVGSSTGFPFGSYDYTAVLQPQIGHVPVIIAIAWLMMLPSSWAIADSITGGKRGVGFIALSALAMTAWDFFLDPQMVSWGLWEWEHVGGYFGIPWVNYAGWLLTAAVVTAIVRPPALPLRPLVLIYATVWGLQTIGQVFFWDLAMPAVVGFYAMGSMLFIAIIRLTRDGRMGE